MKAPGILIPLLLLAGSLSVAAQEPAPAGANVEGMQIGDTIDVRVVNVEAVVTDSRGRRIKGLNPKDFRLLIDGKDVPIDYFTEIRGGAASNVIPAEVFLQGTLRSFDDDVREQLLEEVERALAVSRAFGGDYRIEVERGYPAGRNHPVVSDWLEHVAVDLLGPGAIDKTRAGMGAEDFAYMTQMAPGAMFQLGAAVGDFTRPHHTPVFDIASLGPGASLAGPAILEAETTTVVVNAGDQVSVNSLGWLDIQLRKPD